PHRLTTDRSADARLREPPREAAPAYTKSDGDDTRPGRHHPMNLIVTFSFPTVTLVSTLVVNLSMSNVSPSFGFATLVLLELVASAEVNLTGVNLGSDVVFSPPIVVWPA